jgi:LacI family transcriptional regulator
MAVTMKQIAEDVGLSIVTVSKALRNHKDISTRTRVLIVQRARDLGYRPNLTARSLVTGRSFLVGMLVPDLVHPFFAEVARSLAAALRGRGLYLLICSSEGDPQLEREQLEHLLSRRLDAIVVAAVGTDHAFLETISRSGTPLVLLDRESPVQSASFIGVDDLAVGMLATQHLIDIGCRRIAHLRGPSNPVGDKRLAGYVRVLREAGMPLLPWMVSDPSTGDVDSTTQGARAAEKMFAHATRPDGLFCFSDPMAMGAMNAALAARLSIPKQVAIVGCGNLHYDGSLRVPLSSIDQKSALIGKRAAQVIIERLQNNRRPQQADDDAEIEARRVIVRPELVVRASTSR